MSPGGVTPAILASFLHVLGALTDSAGVLMLETREPYRLGLHNGLALLPVVVLIDRAAFTALAIGVNAGSTAFARVSVDERVNEHRGLGRTQTSAVLVKHFVCLFVFAT